MVVVSVRIYICNDVKTLTIPPFEYTCKSEIKKLVGFEANEVKHVCLIRRSAYNLTTPCILLFTFIFNLNKIQKNK